MTPKEIVVEEVEFMTSCGVPVNQIARALGISLTGVSRACRRAGRPELATPFDRAYKAERKKPCSDCGTPIYNDARRERCHPCAMRHRNDDPEYWAALLQGVARRGRTAA